MKDPLSRLLMNLPLTRPSDTLSPAAAGERGRHPVQEFKARILRQIFFPFFATALSLVLATACPGEAANASAGSIDARMLRYPAVSQANIAFVFAGDIRVVPKTGGTATRLSSPARRGSPARWPQSSS